jgi:allantoinase
VSGTRLVVRARRAVVDGAIRAAAVHLRDGVVTEITPYDDASLRRASHDTPAGVEVITLADDEVLLAGLVDSHVHVNEPGRTEWEGFATATRAAAAGGVTTLVDMPLNSIPPTTSVAALETKRQAARDQVAVDVAFWGGVVPGNLGALAPLQEAGVVGFKAFLAPSGVDEFPPVTYAELEAALRVLAPRGALTVVHAEDPTVLAAAAGPAGRDYGRFLAGRPPEAEQVAVDRLVDLARSSGARIHVLHVSSAAALDAVAAAQQEGLAVTAETCPHYLTLAAEDVPDGATPYKCCPPVRDAANRDRLWDALRAGVLRTVVSDHSPCTPDLKALDSGDFDRAWGGIASLQLGLPLVWTAARQRGFDLADVVRWMAQGPADLVGLPHKGRIAPGADADLVAFAPEEAWTVNAAALRHRNPVSPYDGAALTGVVRRTWLHGSSPGSGRLLTPG